jgi:membrane protein DedA with SNARE-associated domain
MSEMEPEVRDFLARISMSILAGLIWLFLNMTIGIFGGWFFFYERPRMGNYIFYVWFIVSLALLIRILYKLWRSRFH